MAEKKNERFIPIKNYVIIFVIILAAILLTIYGFEWYKVVKENKVSTSYLIKEKVITKEITDLNEVANVFSEAPQTYFIYISYTGDEEIYNMEKGLKSTINEFGINDIFYYLNVTSIKDDKDYIDKINESLKLEDIKVTNVPTIIYYQEGTPVYIISKEDNTLMTNDDFQKLLDINNVSK